MTLVASLVRRLIDMGGGLSRNHVSTQISEFFASKLKMSTFKCRAESFLPFPHPRLRYPDLPPAPVPRPHCLLSGCSMNNLEEGVMPGHPSGRGRLAFAAVYGEPHRATRCLIRMRGAAASPGRWTPAAWGRHRSPGRRRGPLPSTEDQVHDPLQLINRIME